MAAALEAPICEEARGSQPEQPVTLVLAPFLWGRNCDPFALAIETWLRLAEIPFSIEERGSLWTLGRMPPPRLRDCGREIVGTEAILRHLKASRGIDPDAGLDERRRAESTALRRLLEDHLYLAILWSRWVDPRGWAVLARELFAPLPAPLRPWASRLHRWRIRQLLSERFGSFEEQQLLTSVSEDLEALAIYLGDKPFFMGEQLTTLDALAYSFLANIYFVPIESELKRLATQYSNLVNFCETMEAGIYGDERGGC